MHIWTEGNRLKLLENGEDYFPSLLKAIRDAQHEILFEVYIFTADKVGSEIAKALMDAAKRGVHVYLILDGIGSIGISENFLTKLRKAGVHLSIFRQYYRLFSLGELSFRRLHRKLVVVDAHIAFVGGMNITTDHLSSSNARSMLDFAVHVEGPVVEKIHRSMKLFALRLQNNWREYLRLRLKRKKEWERFPGKAQSALVLRDNLKYRKQIEGEYLRELKNAKKEIIIANAYFLPGLTFRRALIHAAKRGVQIILLLQGRAEFLVLKYATRALYKEFFDAGIQIIEYNEKILHAKVAVVDEEWATVGSCNLDVFSLFLNLEANLSVRDPTFCRELRSKLLKAIQAGGQIVEPKPYLHPPLYWRVINWLCLFHFRILIFFSRAAVRDPIFVRTRD